MAGRFTLQAVFEAVDRITGPIGRMQTRAQKFTRSVTLGMRRLDKATSAVSRTLRTGLVRGFGAATVAAGATLMAMNGMAAEADVLAKRTRALDFDIEAFQEYQFVAEQSGVTSQEFGKSIETMSKRVGEARLGTGELITVLKKSDAQLLKNLQATKSSEEAMDLMIATLERTEDPLKRAALANAFFGRTGIKMVNMANAGAEGIAALRAEMRANGIITQDQAAAAEKYNDAMNSMNKALDSLKRDVLMPLLPVMTDLFNRTREWATTNRELISSQVVGFLTDLRDNFSTIVTWLERIGTALAVFFIFQAVLKSFIMIMTAVNLVMALNPIGLIVLGVLAAVAAFTALVFWIDGIAAGFNKLPRIIRVLLAPLTLLINAIKFIKDNMDTIQSGFSRVGNFLGFGGGSDSEDQGNGSLGNGFSPQTVSPQEIIARTISESNTAERNYITIRDETGRAQTEGRTAGRGVTLQSSGGF